MSSEAVESGGYVHLCTLLNEQFVHNRAYEALMVCGYLSRSLGDGRPPAIIPMSLNGAAPCDHFNVSKWQLPWLNFGDFLPCATPSA